jgi:hypothetical protein
MVLGINFWRERCAARRGQFNSHKSHLPTTKHAADEQTSTLL